MNNSSSYYLRGTRISCLSYIEWRCEEAREEKQRGAVVQAVAVGCAN